MPDLATHTVLGYFLTRRWVPAPAAFLFLVGNMLPDLLTRPVYILFPEAYWWVYPFHTPTGMLAFCWGVTGLFHREDRKAVFWSLMAGAMAHFALDAFQEHVGRGYLWFSPVSWWFSGWGLFRPEEALARLPWFIGAAAAGEAILRIYRRRRLTRKS